MRKKIAWVMVALVGVVLVVFIGQNTAPVQGRFLWYSAEKPAIVWLFLATTGGFVLGVIAALLVKSRQGAARSKQPDNSAGPET